MTAVLHAAALTCIRGERMVFRGLSFDVEAGAALVLRGPNGSGKSSLLRLCAGLLAPAEGTLVWGGQPADAEDLRRIALYLGHQDALKPALTLQENLAFWARFGGTEARIDAALEAFALAHLADLPVRQLSAGQRRRAALARLLVADRPLWLLDEPANALDTASNARLAAAVAAHRAVGGVVMAATHTELDLPAAAVLTLQ